MISSSGLMISLLPELRFHRTRIFSKEVEYELPLSKINEFISWYESKGIDKSYFIFQKQYNKGPFKTRKEYIIFDKIVSFEVNEY